MRQWMMSIGGLAIVAGAASAAVSGVTGQGQLIAPPPVANFPGLTGPLADVWNEQTNVTLPASGILVDMLVNGGFMSSNAPTPGVVTGAVDSHFIHFTAGSVSQAAGQVTFSAPILAVIYSDVWLDQSDFLGAFGTTYPTGQPFRGMNNLGIVVANGNVLDFNFADFSGAVEVEQVRVLTRAIPAPGAAALAAVGGLMMARRRR